MKKLSIYIFIVLLSTYCYGQEVRQILLKPIKMNFSPKEFYIDAVKDSRANIDYIAKMNNGNVQYNLKNGVQKALGDYIKNNITQNNKTIPITLHFTKLEGKVKKTNKLHDITMTLSIGFYFEDKMLMELTTNGQITSTTDPNVYIESFTRQGLEEDLKKFDDWWRDNKSKIPVNNEVKINISIGTKPDKPNQIVYNPLRRLTIADFLGTPDDPEGNKMAITYSGVGFGYTTKIENSQVVVYLTITPFFDKEQSWFKEEGKTPRILAHEQLHFDIRALQACQLANSIRATIFNKNNYITVLEQLRQQNAANGIKEQDEYDEQTNHGTIKEQQDKWSHKVKEMMTTVNCF